MAARAFHPFCDLSPELRNAIWAFAAAGDEEHIVVVVVGGSRVLKPDGVLDWKFSCSSPNPLPITFHVNQESRDESFRMYPNTIQLGQGQKIHFNGMCDRIFLDASSIYNIFMFSKIQCRFKRGDIMPYDAEQFKPGALHGFNNVTKLAVTFSPQSEDIANLTLRALRSKTSLLAGVEGDILQETKVLGAVLSWRDLARKIMVMYENIIDQICPMVTEKASEDWPLEVIRARLNEESLRIRVLNDLFTDVDLILATARGIVDISLDD